MRSLFLAVCASALLMGCVSTPPKPAKTQLQIREFQTREYNGSDVKIVMKAMLNVLQDDNFIVKNAVADLGLLTATKGVDIQDGWQRFFSVMANDNDPSWPTTRVIEASANVSEFGQKTKVRINFQAKIMNNRGGVEAVETIEDEAFYQDFFAKVDKGVFLQQQKL